MKKILIVLTVVFAACTNQVKTDQHDKDNLKQQEYNTAVVQLNNGSKWKADEATKKNVAAMVSIVNDSRYTDTTKRRELFTNLKGKIDTLVNDCSMKGAEHEALHLWLEKILMDMRELKEEDNEYFKTYAVLKKDIESFNAFFG